MMRAATIALVASCFCLLAIQQAEARSDKCRRPSQSTVVTSTASSIVYVRRGTGTSSGDTDYFGCLRSAGKRVLLLHGDLDSGPARARRVQLAGRYAGLVADTAYHDVHDLTVKVYDLRSGRQIRRAEVAASVVKKPNGQLQTEVKQLVLSTRGVVAWRASGLLIDRSGEADTVGVADTQGVRVVATDPLGSLSGPRLTTTRVTWQAAGASRSAPITTR